MSHPAYRINDYILNASPVGNLLGVSTDEFSPIMPTQATPEAIRFASGKPYIVYDTRIQPNFSMWWLETLTLTYWVSGASVDEINDVFKAIKDVCSRMDDSAAELNSYLIANNKSDYDFKYVKVNSESSPNPADQEKGRLYAALIIEAEFCRKSGSGIA